MSRAAEEQRIVSSFATMMLGKMRANSHKPHWRTLSTDDLVECLNNELDELLSEIRHVREGHGRPGKLAMEAADVANILAMLVDRVRPESE